MEGLPRIVVGVDFGTTYTAVAWAESSSPSQLEIITNWPTAGTLVGAQTPSEISYDDNDNTKFTWGYNISPHAWKIKWFKLGLEVEDKVLKLPAHLTSVDVVHHYLSAIYQHTMTTLYRRFDRGVMQMTKVDFVLTVPAIWSDAAKKRTEDAAIRAGMGNEHNLQLLSEPESAAVYTIKSLDKPHAELQVHDRVVVCDAGGGTVDLITYDIQQMKPHLSVIECTAGTGEFCGSTFIDRQFEKLFIRRMGHHYQNISVINRQQTVRNFEGTKIAFRDDPNQPTFYVNVPTVGSLEEAGVYGGNFEITRDEMRGLFDPVIDQVLALINGQINAATKDRHRVNSILLVGGFGESEYLYKRVHLWASQIGVQVIQPREAATSIVRGAVMKGLEPKVGPEKTQIVRRARRSYGVPTKQHFIEGKHLEEDATTDAHTGQKLAQNQVSWFIRKDQIMSDDQTFRNDPLPLTPSSQGTLTFMVGHKFYRHFRHLEVWKDELVSCSLDVPPTREDQSITKLCTVVSDLTYLKKRSSFKRNWSRFKPYYLAYYDIVFHVENNNLRFTLEYNGQNYGVASVEFEQ